MSSCLNGFISWLEVFFFGKSAKKHPPYPPGRAEFCVGALSLSTESRGLLASGFQ